MAIDNIIVINIIVSEQRTSRISKVTSNVAPSTYVIVLMPIVAKSITVVVTYSYVVDLL